MPPSTFSKAKLSIMQHMLEYFLQDDKLPQQRLVIYKERVRRLTAARRRVTIASIVKLKNDMIHCFSMAESLCFYLFGNNKVDTKMVQKATTTSVGVIV
jgi:hypothetical protein